ncbi:MAG: AAA family ATPase [Ottowia sp.]|nr:AAA family ATPase [Ottowia sp.]
MSATDTLAATRVVRASELFGFETELQVHALAEPSDLTPQRDPDYQFDPEVTLALLVGFEHNRRVLIQGLHGTGKSTHVEQVAARLNWPCMRVNLDGHISRMDLVGKDTIVLRQGQQVIEWQDGIVPWALQQPMALLFDEYDAGRPDVMFVIQRLLEKDGQFTLVEQNRVLQPHPQFRIFATANTVGQGNTSGLYHGVQRLNQAQLDRWSLVTQLNYLHPDVEARIICAHAPELATPAGDVLVRRMIALAAMTRNGFAAGDISTLMTPRTLIMWAENMRFFTDVAQAFRLTYLNKCEEEERVFVAEYFQRCFEQELPDSFVHHHDAQRIEGDA